MDDAILRGQSGRAYDLMQNPAAVSGAISRGHVQSVELAVNPRLWSSTMAQRIAERASNGYVRKIAQDLIDGTSIDDITLRFMDDKDLGPILTKYIANQGNLDPNYVWDFDGIRDFVLKIVDDIEVYTMGDDSILEAIAKNTIKGSDLRNIFFIVFLFSKEW
jgi:hypothetical protein